MLHISALVVSLKSLKKGFNLIPNQGHKNWLKGCIFEKSKKLLRKGFFLGPTLRIKFKMFMGFREKGGGLNLSSKSEKGIIFLEP